MNWPNDFIDKIIQGDCLEIMKEIPDKSVDLVLTDPPYNTGMIKNDSARWLKNFFNDQYSEEEYQTLVVTCCNNFFRILKEDKNIYIFINWKEYPRWFYALKQSGFSIKACIVWDKVVHGLGGQYKYTHEFIIFGSKGTPKIKEPAELHGYYKDIWRIQRLMGTKIHDTQKVLKIIELPILHATSDNDIILDPFLGSGTTAVACKKLNRRFIGIELEQKYIDTANKQLEQEQFLDDNKLDW